MHQKRVTHMRSMKNNFISSLGHIFKFSFTNNGLNILKFIKLNLTPMILPHSAKVSIDRIFEVSIYGICISTDMGTQGRLSPQICSVFMAQNGLLTKSTPPPAFLIAQLRHAGIGIDAPVGT